MSNDVLCICGHPASVHKNHERYVGFCHAEEDDGECGCEGFEPSDPWEDDFLGLADDDADEEGYVERGPDPQTVDFELTALLDFVGLA